MFTYYVDLALRSFRRNKVLTALMVLAIALGIGASMTTLTVFHVLSGDPIPDKSATLFHAQLDAEVMDGYAPDQEPNGQLTRFDAQALLREKRGTRQAMMTGGSVSIEPTQSQLPPFRVDVRYSSADIFPMFAMPFLYGSGWSAAEDEGNARVVVITKALNERLFGGSNSTGKTILVDKTTFQILGVLDEWRPTPKFYDMNGNSGYGETDQVFLPFSTSRDLEMARSGNMNCWGDSREGETDVNAPCAWIQYWVELDSPEQADAYRQYLTNYSDQQRAAGRFERPTNVRLRNVMEWLEFNRVVPRDVVMQVWLAFGFLLVCLVNTVGLLLAKFMRRSGEVGVRRALGASRREIFLQCLTEAGAVGLAGGILGLVLAWIGLWAVRQQPTDYADLAHLDPAMLVTTFVIAIVASLLAGLLPAWSAMQVSPAMQLKSQ
ncbi:ABC transporter permease [Lysobacter sp. A289]